LTGNRADGQAEVVQMTDQVTLVFAKMVVQHRKAPARMVEA
jgi:hypothetical protein